jgi:hypothetical protein
MKFHPILTGKSNKGKSEGPFGCFLMILSDEPEINLQI